MAMVYLVEREADVPGPEADAAVPAVSGVADVAFVRRARGGAVECRNLSGRWTAPEGVV